jgi:hypothetical protein
MYFRQGGMRCISAPRNAGEGGMSRQRYGELPHLIGTDILNSTYQTKELKLVYYLVEFV